MNWKIDPEYYITYTVIINKLENHKSQRAQEKGVFKESAGLWKRRPEMFTYCTLKHL